MFTQTFFYTFLSKVTRKQFCSVILSAVNIYRVKKELIQFINIGPTRLSSVNFYRFIFLEELDYFF